MLLKTLRRRFSKLHLLTQFYVHNVLYSQTKETEVTKYPFVQWVRKHEVLHLVLCTWEAENSCCWCPSDENSNLLLITDHIRTSRIYPSAPAVHSPLKPTPPGCCWGHRLSLANANAFWHLTFWHCCSPLTTMPQGGKAGQPPSFHRKRAHHISEAGCKTSGRAAAATWMCNSLVTRLNTRGQWWQLPSQGERPGLQPVLPLMRREKNPRALFCVPAANSSSLLSFITSGNFEWAHLV